MNTLVLSVFVAFCLVASSVNAKDDCFDKEKMEEQIEKIKAMKAECATKGDAEAVKACKIEGIKAKLGGEFSVSKLTEMKMKYVIKNEDGIKAAMDKCSGGKDIVPDDEIKPFFKCLHEEIGKICNMPPMPEED